MAMLNYDFYEKKDDEQYSDGSIESEMYQMLRSGEVDWVNDCRWPVIYHFSHLRHNILNWYPFKKDCSILEIGAGCGALTGLLCQKAKHVVAIELTKLRAKINYERHKNIANLDLYISDFNRFKSNEKFDYIIINDVLEYAAYMCAEDDPHQAFLVRASQFLKPDGEVLIAIENRLGLKYFSGAREDHTGEWFSGVNNYTQGERVRTFSKSELITVLKKAGLTPRKFYYPFPDYKFPQEILTDSSVNDRMPLELDFHLDSSYEYMYNTRVVHEAFAAEGIADTFANSFLVIANLCGQSLMLDEDIGYVKISANRSPAYRIATILYDRRNEAVKIPLTEAAAKHLQKMSASAGKCDGVLKNVACLERGTQYVFPLLKNPSLYSMLKTLCDQGKVIDARKKLETFCRSLLANLQVKQQSVSEEFIRVFGSDVCTIPLHWATNLNIDLTASNVMIEDGGYSVIDYEWIFPFEIPVEYIIWRLVMQVQNDLQKLQFGEMIEELGIRKEISDVFVKWEQHFANEYIGIVNLNRFAKENLNRVYRVLNGSVKLPDYDRSNALYWDNGSGFSEKNKIIAIAVKIDENEYTVSFALPENHKIERLRWDPIEHCGCEISILEMETQGTIDRIFAGEYSIHDGNRWIQYSSDPQLILSGDFEKADSLYIHFQLHVFGAEQIYEGLKQMHLASEQEQRRVSEEHEKMLREEARKQEQLWIEESKTREAQLQADAQIQRECILEEFAKREREWKQDHILYVMQLVDEQKKEISMIREKHADELMAVKQKALQIEARLSEALRMSRPKWSWDFRKWFSRRS